MSSRFDSAFPRQLQWAFLLGMAGAIVLMSVIGSTEGEKLHATLGPGASAPRAARPITPVD